MSWARAIATVGGIGRLKPAPGTWGSAVALLVALPIVWVFDWFGLLVGVALVVALGTWAADAHEGETGDHDASEVVIDEVAGQWIALLPVAHLDTMPWWTWLIAFALFRLFDIWKPGPIGRLDRSFEGGAGTMADDVAAGLLAALVLALLSPLLTP